MAKIKPNKTQTPVKSQTPARTKPTAAPATVRMLPDHLLLAGCLIATFLVFANTLNAGFVNWDDHGYLWLNKLVQPLKSVDWKAVFSDHTCGNYSPLVVLSYCLEHSFDPVLKPGLAVADNFRPFVYHLSNVLIHIATTALAFVFLRQLGLKGWGLALATALFGLHPMRVESVAWVTERKDVLYGFFYLASLIYYHRYLTREGSKSLNFSLALLLGLLSLFSKIQAVSLPLSMLALDYFTGRNLKTLKPWAEKIPFFALSLVFGLVGIHFVGLAEGFKETGYPLFARFIFALYSVCMYFIKLVAPFGLATYYPYPKPGAIPPYYYAAPLGVMALAFAVWRSTKYTRVAAFGVLFFLVNIVFVLQIKGAGKAFMADRFTYIPYLGLFFIIGYYYNRIVEGKWWPQLRGSAPLLATGFIALCAVLTFLQNRTWKDSVALWENVTKQSPGDYLGWSNKGLALHDAGRYEQAIAAYEQAIKIDPLNHEPQHNKAVSLFALKRYAEAAQAFGEAVKRKPDESDSWFYRGQAYAQSGNFTGALADYEKARQLGSKKPAEQLHFATGMALAGLNRHPEALAAFDAALKSKAEPETWYQKGNSYAAMGDMAAAIGQYEEALKIKPDYDDAINNKGNALATMGRHAEALAAFDRAIVLRPNAPNYYANRGLARHVSGDRAGACADWQKALQLGYVAVQPMVAQHCKQE